SPIDATHRQIDTITYDAMSRVLSKRDSGETAASGSRMVLNVANLYDAEGNLVRVTQTGSPDQSAIGSVARTFAYDAAGRKIREGTLAGSTDVEVYSWTYDAAGNFISGGRDALMGAALTYDALNRLTSRSGANAASFTYDNANRLLTA